VNKLTPAQIRRWYHKAGLDFQQEDWGTRNDTGESSGRQRQEPERSPGKTGSTSVRSTDSTPARTWWWEKQHFPWQARGAAERRWIYTLDAFFSPYLAMLPRPKGNLVRQVFADGYTYTEVGQKVGMKRQSAHEAVRRAVRDLMRIIAEDDPLFHAAADGRRRDYEDEARAARRVLMVYLEKRRKEEEA